MPRNNPPRHTNRRRRPIRYVPPAALPMFDVADADPVAILVEAIDRPCPAGHADAGSPCWIIPADDGDPETSDAPAMCGRRVAEDLGIDRLPAPSIHALGRAGRPETEEA